MDTGRGQWKLKSLGYYFRKSFRFYELKNERLTRALFLIVLVMSFAGAFLPEQKTLSIIFDIMSIIVIYFASNVYLAAYIKDLKGEEYNWRNCFYIVVRHFFKIIFTSLPMMLTILLAIGLSLNPVVTSYAILVLLIPGVVVCLIFLLNTCYVVDGRSSIIQAYKASWKATKGYKGGIFGIFVAFNLALAFPTTFILMAAISTNNQLVAAFVLSFIGVIVNFMQQRLIALIYKDLQYSQDTGIGRNAGES